MEDNKARQGFSNLLPREEGYNCTSTSLGVQLPASWQTVLACSRYYALHPFLVNADQATREVLIPSMTL